MVHLYTGNFDVTCTQFVREASTFKPRVRFQSIVLSFFFLHSNLRFFFLVQVSFHEASDAVLFFQCIAATFRLEQQTKAVLEECCSSTCIKKILYLYSMLLLIALHKKTRVYKGFHSIFFQVA